MSPRAHIDGSYWVFDVGSDMLGLVAILLISLFCVILALRRPEVAKIIYTALIVRLIFLLTNSYVIALPDSTKDARSYEQDAWDWAQDGFFNLSNYYTGPDAEFISWMIAIPYSLFGRSLLMAQSISLFFGIASVYLGWLLARKLWDNKTATKVGWIIALFPTLILYSVLTLREVFVCFFLLVAMFGVVNWVRVGGYKPVTLAMSGFIGATFFHGALFLGGIVFLIFVAKSSFSSSFRLLKSNRISPKALTVVVISFVILTLYFSNEIRISKIGTFKESIQIFNLNRAIDVRLAGDASYPNWTIINSPIEFLYKAPIRAIYFLVSPFPWDVKKISHLIGMFDAFLYMILVYLIFRNRKVIWEDTALRIILLILISYFLIFGIGVSNFGTGLRHRSKFVIELIILAAPLIPRFIFLKKIRNKN